MKLATSITASRVRKTILLIVDLKFLHLCQRDDVDMDMDVDMDV